MKGQPHYIDVLLTGNGKRHPPPDYGWEKSLFRFVVIKNILKSIHPTAYAVFKSAFEVSSIDYQSISEKYYFYLCILSLYLSHVLFLSLNFLHFLPSYRKNVLESI